MSVPDPQHMAYDGMKRWTVQAIQTICLERLRAGYFQFWKYDVVIV